MHRRRNSAMILGFDIGNTSTTLGMYRLDGIIPFNTLRYDTLRDEKAETIVEKIQASLDGIGHLRERGGRSECRIEGFVFSSAVTEVNGAYHEAARRGFSLKALEINRGMPMNIRLNYERPEMLGPDRIVNAAAAWHLHGGDVIVIDMGTATTISVLLADGAFDGGAIAPGIGSTMEHLARRTSRLMEVPIEKPPSPVGHNTTDCIQSGFFHGWQGMMEGFVRKIMAFYGREFTVVLTGGFSGRFAGNLGFSCIIDPLLTMKGIKVLYDIGRR